MTGAVLAGGASRRMGTNKAFITVDGSPIITGVLTVLQGLFDERLIIADDVKLYSGLGAATLPDAFKGAGSLGGIYTALLHASSETVFVCACDMPDINTEAVRRVITTPLDDALAVVPFISRRLHPMHALYSQECLTPIEEMIKAGNLRIMDLFKKIKIKRLTEADFKGLDIRGSVANINTQEELRERGVK